MRLIDTQTLELGEFFGEDIPKYAALSHTWGREEVMIREWTEPSDRTTSKAGYKKVSLACSLARRFGHAWLWADTVCIDKTSSAELSEAINSMFAWYQGAETCFAYLEDVAKDSLGTTIVTEDPETAPSRAGLDEEQYQGRTAKIAGIIPEIGQFRRSRWFTRGWTLQELIAPADLVFYSREWARLGTKIDLAREITTITGIEVNYLLRGEGYELQGAPSFLKASVAERMSWLATRRTTRIEDIAYCMLGIFDINMPLLYGEGAKAFIRLQEEIIKVNHDHSIFAWNHDAGSHDKPSTPSKLGILAHSPRAFADAAGVFALGGRTKRWGSPDPKSAYSLTNLGLSIRLPLLRMASGYIAVLAVHRRGLPYKDHLGVVLSGDLANEAPLSRAATPSAPLVVPRNLHLHFRIQSVFLNVKSPRQLAGNLSDLSIPASPSDNLSDGPRGLLLTFEGPLTLLPVKLHEPNGSFHERRSLLTFPKSNSGFWRESKQLLEDGIHAYVHTTGVLFALGKWHGRPLRRGNEAQDSRVKFSVIFMLSVISIMVPDVVREYRFGHQVFDLQDGASWSAYSGSSSALFPDSPIRTRIDAVIRKENDEAMTEVVSRATSSSRPFQTLHAVAERPRKDPLSGYTIYIDPTDVKYPDYAEVRLVQITVPEEN
jgi:hypothetical protein